MTKKIFNLSLLLLIGAILTGCETYGPHAKRGTAIGGTTGAVIGAVIGHQSDETGSGALAGAAAGAIIGGLWGSARDREENDREEEIRQHRAFELDSLRDDEWEPEFEPL